ncbi:SafA/ExsA family spore coat assembly protein [Aceticella autotrophica]|uniref:SafA/ExsA family spore coat assembly protein n=2 Tax=Aceticella autotrophica TaxID=2755338 RepID=A0A975GBI5_9THEO|nr:SafA/ExsA family spore coat assembly protein [Aceticella autotrophica]
MYIVKPGDTMWSIANMYGIPLDCLIKANPQIPNPNLIYPGQEICIPAYCPPVGPCKTVYIVKPGDTMWSIANMYGISLDCLIKANPQIPNPNLIYPGQQICIPTHYPSVGPYKTVYIVKPGDTMWSIANMYGIPLDCLIKANPQIPDPNLIYPGQQIYIPNYPPIDPPIS